MMLVARQGNNMKEIRTFGQELRVETRNEHDGKKLVGYAAVFDSNSVEMGGFLRFTESIQRGAFARTLRENQDVRGLLDHDTSQVIGRTVAGSLTLEEDDYGLRATFTPPDTFDARRAVEMVDAGLITNMSFGFETVNDKWSIRDGIDHRELLDVNLFEVSLVTFPAYPATSIGVRSLEAVYDQRQKMQPVKLFSYRTRLASL